MFDAKLTRETHGKRTNSLKRAAEPTPALEEAPRDASPTRDRLHVFVSATKNPTSAAPHSLLAAGCSGLSTNTLSSLGSHTAAASPPRGETSHRPTTTRATACAPPRLPRLASSAAAAFLARAPSSCALHRAPVWSAKVKNNMSYALPVFGLVNDLTPVAGSRETTAPITESFVFFAEASPALAFRHSAATAPKGNGDAADVGHGDDVFVESDDFVVVRTPV